MTSAVLGVTPESVIEAATELWKLRPYELLTRDKSKPLVEYRFAAMYVARKLCGLSYPATARAFNRLDHTTVMNAVKRVEGDGRLLNLAGRLEKEVVGETSL